MPKLFGAAEEAFGPVDVRVDNAGARVVDTFTVADRLGRHLRRVSQGTIGRQFGVAARASGSSISEDALRHVRHDLAWGRIIGFASGGPLGFPDEVPYGAAQAARRGRRGRHLLGARRGAPATSPQVKGIAGPGRSGGQVTDPRRQGDPSRAEPVP